MKAWTIAVKDTLVRFRDRNALVLMIAAPLLISFVMGMAFGGQGAAASPISEIPLLVVNLDEGDLGAEFAGIIETIDVETRDGEKPLFSITEMDSREAGLEQVELGETRGMVYIPPGFTDDLRGSFENDGDQEIRVSALVEVFTDPAASVSPGVIRGVVSRIANGFSTVVLGNVVAVDQLIGKVTDIPVTLVVSDEGPLAEAVTEAFSPENFEGLFILTQAADLADAQAGLDAGETEAVIHVQEGFSQAVLAGGTGEDAAANLEVLTRPASLAGPIVEPVARSIAMGFGSDAQPGAAGEEPAVLANLDNLAAILTTENDSFGETEGTRQRIDVNTSLVGESQDFNLLNYFVPSMAIFFLMFAVFDGTRSILAEERDGTLHRMLTTPTGRYQILLGKIGGTFLTGLLQFTILVAISWLIFDVDWGRDPLGIALLVLGTVSAATSLGALIASFARNSNQANVIGTAVTLVFAILGGNFLNYQDLPDWLHPISRLTINRWAMEGITNLTLFGQNLGDVLLPIGMLFLLAVIFFAASLALFNRRFVR